MEDTGKTIALIKALSGGGGSLPPITDADNGKVLTANSGVWVASGDIVLNVIQDGYQIDVTSDLPSMETVANTFKSGRNVVFAFANGAKCVLKPFQKETDYEFDYYTFNGYGYDREGQKYHAYINLYDDEGITAYHAYYIDADRFIVTLTPTALDYSGTMDKTVAEIDAAYKAGQQIVFRLMTGASTWIDAVVTNVTEYGGSTYPLYTARAIYVDKLMEVGNEVTQIGTTNAYTVSAYDLTPAT